MGVVGVATLSATFDHNEKNLRIDIVIVVLA
jgi:hypothetical protein